MDREEKFRSFRKIERVGAGFWLVLNVIFLVIQGFFKLPAQPLFIVESVYWIGDLMFWLVILILSMIKKPYEENYKGSQIGMEQICLVIIILLRVLMAVQHFTGVAYLNQFISMIFGR